MTDTAVGDRPQPTAAETLMSRALEAWEMAEQVANLLLVDPVGLGGVIVRSAPGPVRDTWVQALKRLAPETVIDVPATIDPDRLLGGLAVDETLRTGRPVHAQGLLSDATGRVVLARLADRMDAEIAALLAAALDGSAGTDTEATGFGLILLDESLDLRDAPSGALCDRLAFQIELDGIPHRIADDLDVTPDALEFARAGLDAVSVPEDAIEALVEAAAALGISSLRAPLFAVRAARALAALAEDRVVGPEHLSRACQLVYGHRALQLPPNPPDEPTETSPPPPPDPSQTDTEPPPTTDLPDVLGERLVNAVKTAIPDGLLSALAGQTAPQMPSRGKSGKLLKNQTHGVRDRVSFRRRSSTDRIDLIETLRAATPWQRIRGRADLSQRIAIRPDDLRARRYKSRSESTVIFVVDASGSSAYARLAEVKGAVEHLLTDCYKRRDQVALIPFGGETVTVLLPPTRSLVRVRRALTGLPGGGTTPLAAALLEAGVLSEAERRRGHDPVVVILSDGRGNIALDGTANREAAETDLDRAANYLKSLKLNALFYDSGRRPSPRAETLSRSIGARYRPLPRAVAESVAREVRDVLGRR